MSQLQIYLKVEVDLEDRHEKPERIASEMCRMLQKLYGVRSAEVSSIVEDR